MGHVDHGKKSPPTPPPSSTVSFRAASSLFLSNGRELRSPSPPTMPSHADAEKEVSVDFLVFLFVQQTTPPSRRSRTATVGDQKSPDCPPCVKVTSDFFLPREAFSRRRNSPYGSEREGAARPDICHSLPPPSLHQDRRARAFSTLDPGKGLFPEGHAAI